MTVSQKELAPKTCFVSEAEGWSSLFLSAVQLRCCSCGHDFSLKRGSRRLLPAVFRLQTRVDLSPAARSISPAMRPSSRQMVILNLLRF